MSEQVSLNAENREIEGKSSSRLLRRSGSVPAVIYGGSKEPLRISILEKDISIKSNEIKKLNFEEEILKITNDDYYYSNVIARASKTMFECKNSKINLKSTGTEG